MARFIAVVAALVTLMAVGLTGGCGSSSTAPTCQTGWLAEQGHRGEQFASIPKLTINQKCKYFASLATTKGTITFSLLPKAAPIAVNSFVFLARHRFYTHILFHRVIRGFMVQTGDPTGTGAGGAGYSFKIENSGSSYPPGTVALAHSSLPNSNGSQFFICDGAVCAASLNKSWANGATGYTILGHVTSGMGVVHAIAGVRVEASPADPSEISKPLYPPVLKSVRIHESP